MRSLLLALPLLLSACASVDAPTDWIEVPLSAETWWEQQGEWRSGEYRIPVAAFSALEYKIGMEQGAMVVYDWSVEIADPALLGVEFHGHTERVGEEPGTVMFYKIHAEGRESGALRAPFTGIHGWYLDNQSEQDLVVELRVAGYYSELE